MVAYIKQLLRPPVFEQDEKTHQAYLLHVILLAFMLMPLPYILYVLIRDPLDAGRTLGVLAVEQVITIIPFILLRRGYVRLAAAMHIITLWFFFAMNSVASSSIYGLAYLLGNGLAILEHDEGRNGADAVLERRLLVFVDVELGDLHLALHLFRDFLERRRDHPAGTAPLRPEIDDHGLARLDDVVVERGIRDLVRGHRCSSFAMPRIESA